MTADLQPYADDKSITIAELTIENSADRVSLYGDLDLTRDKAGLGKAQQLMSVIEAVVRILEDDKNLPDAVPAATIGSMKNPFQ